MASAERQGQDIRVEFAEDADTSRVLNLGYGCGIAAIIVPDGSDLIDKDLQFVAHSPAGHYADVEVLSTPITLAAGLNRLTTEQFAEVAILIDAKLTLDSAVSEDSHLNLLWKS